MTTAPRRSRRVPGVRQLASGRWQARFTDPAGVTRTLGTFDSYDEAAIEVSRVNVKVADGTWRPPAPNESLATYVARWLVRRAEDLAPGTRDNYEDLAAHWLLRPVKMPGASGRHIDLGALPLRAITVAAVTDWHAAVRATAAANVKERAKATAKRRTLTDTAAARRWAAAAGLDVPPSGRLSAAVMDAWRAANSPKPKPPAVEVPADAGKTTAARAYALLRTVLADAAREELIPSSPCIVRGAGSSTHEERVPATPEEVATITAAMPRRYAAAVPVLAWGALRFGELAALRRRDVTITRDESGTVTGGAVRIERAMSRTKKDGLTFGKPKTKASKRTVNLPASAAVALAEHVAEFTGRRADDLVFTSSSGGPLQAPTWLRPFKRARAAAGRPDLHTHDLRHTGLTWAARVMPGMAGIKAVQARAGHSTMAAAIRYQHLASTADTEIAARLDSLMSA